MSESKDTILGMSQKVKDVISFFREAESDYKWHSEQLEYTEKKTQDLLHILELDTTTKNERNRIATELRTIRRARREHKDVLDLTRPVMELLQSDKGKQIYNLMSEVQGRVKKAESYHANRQYWMRVPLEGDRKTIKNYKSRVDQINQKK